jgi:hypothetical protein
VLYFTNFAAAAANFSVLNNVGARASILLLTPVTANTQPTGEPE